MLLPNLQGVIGRQSPGSLLSQAGQSVHFTNSKMNMSIWNTESKPSVTDFAVHLSQTMCLCTCSILEKLQNLPWLIHQMKTLAKKHLERILQIICAVLANLCPSRKPLSHYLAPGISVPIQTMQIFCGTSQGHETSWTNSSMVIYIYFCLFSTGSPAVPLPVTSQYTNSCLLFKATFWDRPRIQL